LTKLRIKKFKRAKRVFANFTAPEIHLIVDMAEILNEELGTTVRLLAMASIKVCLQKQNKTAKDMVFAYLGKGSTRPKDERYLGRERTKDATFQPKEEGSAGGENPGNPGQLDGGLPSPQGV